MLHQIFCRIYNKVKYIHNTFRSELASFLCFLFTFVAIYKQLFRRLSDYANSLKSLIEGYRDLVEECVALTCWKQ